MRRRALHLILRSARRPFTRSFHNQRARLLQYRNIDRERDHARNADFQAIHSSMYFRSFSITAVVSAFVASGAYFVYRPTINVTSLKDASATASFSTVAAEAGHQVLEATRKALILDRDQLYTGTIPGDAPISKETDDAGRRVLEVMTPEQATARMRKREESYLNGRGKGVVRYDVVQLPSNDPIEDDHAEAIIEVPHGASSADTTSPTSAKSDSMFWGVYDGHSGWTTSAKLRQALISYVARELNTTYSGAHKNTSTTNPSLPSPETIDAAIKRGFVALDTSIVHDSVNIVFKSASKPKAASLLAPALSGSCALLSFYDSATKTLRVACTGDSRAILGRRSTTKPEKWTALALSEDQTGGTPSEMARLRAEHPGEPNVVSAGRVLGGLEPSRAFGDASYKWSREVQQRIKNEFFGRTASSMIKTPPYVTAEPVVTTTKVEPERGDFLVLATDGLWEMLTNEEVVGLVGQWLERHPEAQHGGTARAQSHSGGAASGGTPKDATADTWLKSWFSSSPKPSTLPIDTPSSPDQASKGGQRAPIRQQQWGLPPTTGPDSFVPTSDRFVVEDNNVATHLVRNALGGADRDMVCSLLTLPSPYSRRYRDDLTVEVVFFGEGEREGPDDSAVPPEADMKAQGRVVVNDEATAKGMKPNAELQSKL